MPARILRSVQMVDESRRMVVPQRADEMPGVVDLMPAGEAGAAVVATPVESDRERVLALALHEFERRWDEREKAQARLLRDADERAEAKLRTEITAAVQRFAGIADAVLAERAELLRASEEAAVRLTLAVARKVVGDAAAIDEKFVLQIVRRALRWAADAQRVVIRVHPDDVQLVEEHLPEWTAAARRSRSLRIEGDASLVRGGCHVETDACEIVASLQEQLDTIETALVEKAQGES